MTDQSIFNADTPEVTPQPPKNEPVQQNDLFADQLGSIKNEQGGQKYDSVKTALDALQHSQTYIPELKGTLSEREQEIESLKAEVVKLKAVEDVVDRLTKTGETPPVEPGMSGDDIANLVERTLSQREQNTKLEANGQAVAKALTDSFGTEAENEFAKKATEVGMSVEELNVLSRKAPKVVLDMFGKTSQPITPTSGSVNTSGFNQRDESNVKRNENSVILGATQQERQQEADRSKQMVLELEANGMSTRDLSNPKKFIEFFGTP